MEKGQAPDGVECGPGTDFSLLSMEVEMFSSMTGFGRASRDFPWGVVTFELTSVNHRYQEFSARLPRELAYLESRLVASLRDA